MIQEAAYRTDIKLKELCFHPVFYLRKNIFHADVATFEIDLADVYFLSDSGEGVHFYEDLIHAEQGAVVYVIKTIFQRHLFECDRDVGEAADERGVHIPYLQCTIYTATQLLR